MFFHSIMHLFVFYYIGDAQAQSHPKEAIIIDFSESNIQLQKTIPKWIQLKHYVCPAAPLQIREDFHIEIIHSILDV